jgi:1,2-diacylglycerol-3-alpha-glucose alpha-1,2-glucosyltransferase
MKVLLYSGFLKIVSKSGVGEAMRHQATTLCDQNINHTTKLRDTYELVHLNTIFPDSLLVSKWARFRGKKVIFYAHSTMEDFKNSFIGSNLFAPLFKRWITYCYNNCDLIITPTNYSRGLLNQYGLHPQIQVLSNGIDTSFFAKDPISRQRFRKKYEIADGQKVVISVGHYIERKGIMDFVELARQLPQYQFYWFGHTNVHLVSKKIRLTLANASPNLHFPGYVCRNDLKDAYCGSDLFLFLTHEETEGIVILEALASKTPILVRDIPIYANWLENGETVYKGNNISDFKSMIVSILTGRVPDLTEKGQRLAVDRNMKSIGQELVQIYQQLG